MIREHRINTAWIGAAAILFAGVTAWAWSPPTDVTNLAGQREVGPRAAADSASNLHLVWFGGSTPDTADYWLIHYQSWNGAAWTAPLPLSGPGGFRPDIAVDGSNNLHVVYEQRGEKEIWYRKRTAGVWSTPLSLRSGGRSVGPHIAVNAAGSLIIVAWHEDGQVGGEWDIFVNVFSNGSWSGVQNISQDVGLSSETRVTMDAADRCHVLWQDDLKNIYHRRRNADGTWTAKKRLDVTDARSGSGDIRVAPNQTLFATFHDDSTGNWDQYVVTSANGGDTWSSPVNVANQPGVTDCCGSVVGDSLNQGVVAWQDYKGIYLSRQLNGAWQPWYIMSYGENQTSPQLILAPNGATHLVWQNRDSASGTWDVYWMWRPVPDPVPPAAVSNLTATPGNTQAVLKWNRSSSVDYVGARIVYRNNGFPSGPSDGTIIHVPASHGVTDTHTHLNMTNGLTYYYAVFAMNDLGSFSAPATATVVASGPADFDRDGDVDQTDFGHFQRCYTGSSIPQTDPACALARMDGDQDVDLNDFAIFQRCLSGAGVYANPLCD